MDKYRVFSFPSFVFFNIQSESYEQYQSQRDYETMKDWLRRKLERLVEPLDEQDPASDNARMEESN